MCGIVGFIKNNVKFNEENLNEMLDKIRHRGPDNLSTYVQDNVYFGHARLSIIDLSDSSNQPMLYKHYSIIFNGEIYNYVELRMELEELGHRFETNGDTEVLLHAYEQWGIECQNKFRGMWAFVLYDKRENIIFGSRDRFGIKPLYYLHTKDAFAFASEIKPLLTLQSIPSPNMAIVSSYLVTNLINFDKQTFFNDIYQLEGGTYFFMDLKEKKINFERYYDLSKVIKNKETNITVDFEEVLDTSFKIHTRSDVLLGSCLSGGLDSSTVTAKVSELMKEGNLKSITAKSISPETDESHFAKVVADHLQLDWHIVEPGYEYFKNNIEECLYYQEEPVSGPSIFMQYTVMQKAKELGVKVMMDGQGGDETLLGYERYYSWMLSDLLRNKQYGLFLKEYKRITKHSKLTGITLMKQYMYFNNFKLRVKYLKKRQRLLKGEYMNLAISNLANLGYATKSLEEMQILELTKTNLPNLLKNEDRNSMLASIEARVPFVDHEVIEKALQLPLNKKINNGYTKYCLREYVSEILPDTISWRKDKKGFEAPTDIWIKNHRKIIEDYIQHSKLIKELYISLPKFEQLSYKESWKLYNLALWEKQYFS
ncbi:asparagine synthase (glutamine-hydrolyzing) [Lysinibacillus sp. FSL H8-0500]|uniref:asparagine synthase (glutamine-hydrolyzing) n=1 Tax=Lysinibacillus sp. FSL H8-0500 TaxID=2921393 RepID=UPI003101A11E